VARIIVYGGPGNDFICVHDNVTLPTLLDSPPGNDVLIGCGGNDVLIGGGRNLLIGGMGNDLLVVGSRDDILSPERRRTLPFSQSKPHQRYPATRLSTPAWPASYDRLTEFCSNREFLAEFVTGIRTRDSGPL
jgi:Ca2+-binding RTX toxin-like protein